MPQRKTAVKDLRKNRRNHMRNLDIRTGLKHAIKDFLKSVQAKNKEEAKKLLSLLYKKLDKAAKRNILSKNTASRRKSRFSKLLVRLA